MDYSTGARRDDMRESAAAIQVGVKAGPSAEEARWSLILSIFFRALAMVWMAEGIEHWRRLIAPDNGAFLDMTLAMIAATFFFAIFDLVAAVGLWMMAPWGGVVWLLTLLAQVVVASMRSSFFFVGGGWIMLFDVALLVAHLILSWRANLASCDPRPLDRQIEAWRVILQQRLNSGDKTPHENQGAR